MKKIKLLLIAFIFLLIFLAFNLQLSSRNKVGSALENQTEQIWLSEIQEAKNLGKLQNKIILVDLYAEWCEPCKMYENVTFQDLEVQNILTKFVKVRLLYDDRTSNNSDFINKFRVLGLPTIIFLSPEGEEMTNFRIEGFLNPKDFLLHLKSIYEKLA